MEKNVMFLETGLRLNDILEKNQEKNLLIFFMFLIGAMFSKLKKNQHITIFSLQ